MGRRLRLGRCGDRELKPPGNHKQQKHPKTRAQRDLAGRNVKGQYPGMGASWVLGCTYFFSPADTTTPSVHAPLGAENAHKLNQHITQQNQQWSDRYYTSHVSSGVTKTGPYVGSRTAGGMTLVGGAFTNSRGAGINGVEPLFITSTSSVKSNMERAPRTN